MQSWLFVGHGLARARNAWNISVSTAHFFALIKRHSFYPSLSQPWATLVFMCSRIEKKIYFERRYFDHI